MVGYAKVDVQPVRIRLERTQKLRIVRVCMWCVNVSEERIRRGSYVTGLWHF